LFINNCVAGHTEVALAWLVQIWHFILSQVLIAYCRHCHTWLLWEIISCGR